MPKHQRSQKSHKKHTKASKKSLRKAAGGGYVDPNYPPSFTDFRGGVGLR